MWLPHIPTYTRRNGARFLPQVYWKDTSVCPNNLISISVTISISASWFVGAFDCRRVGLSASWLSAIWIDGELVCWRVGLSASWSVGELAVGKLVCRQVVQLPDKEVLQIGLLIRFRDRVYR